MKKWRYLAVGMALCLVTGWSVLIPGKAFAAQILQYSCSAQVYEAFENSRLNAFTKATGIQVDLFVASSASCVYRVMQDLTDVASTTRPIFKRYKDAGLVELPFCQDPLAVIVHKSLPVDRVTSGELRLLFSGNIANWNELGGPDLPVVLVVPDKESGAYQNFYQQVMKRNEIQYDYLSYKSTRVLEAVESLPPGAVSFTSRGAQIVHPDIKVLRVDGETPGDPDYPYYQIFYLVFKGTPKGEMKQFVDFITSEKGKAIILERGMLPIE